MTVVVQIDSRVDDTHACMLLFHFILFLSGRSLNLLVDYGAGVLTDDDMIVYHEYLVLRIVDTNTTTRYLRL